MKKMDYSMLERLLARFRYAWIALFAFMLVGIYAAIALNFSFLNPISQGIKDFSLTDIYYQVLRQSPGQSQAITVVDMSKLYSRSKVAALLYDIEAANPKVIGVDITFKDKRTDLVGNEMLVDIAKNSNNIVFAYYRQDVVNVRDREVHSFFTDSIPVTEGFTDMPRGLYGKMKRMVPLAGESRGEICHSFSSAVANMYAGKELVPLSQKSQNINFEPTEFSVVDADDVLDNPELLEGRIVLVGGINRIEDMHDTPLGKMAGTMLLAYSIQTILEDKEVTSMPYIWLAIFSFAVVVVTFYGQKKYVERLEKKVNNLLMRSVLSSTYVTGLLTSLWTAFLLFLTFLLFYKFKLNVNLGWALAAIACSTSSVSLYNAFYDTVKKKKEEAVVAEGEPGATSDNTNNKE